MTRQQRIDRAKRVQRQHEQLRHNYIEFGRKPYRCSQAQLANRRAAIGFAILAAASFAGSMWLDQPVLALAAFLFLATAAIIAKDA